MLSNPVPPVAGTGPSDPYEAYANYNLGYTLIQLHNCPAAVTYLHRADHLEPGNNAVHTALAQASRC